jgi:hypothetical protein
MEKGSIRKAERAGKAEMAERYDELLVIGFSLYPPSEYP